jgi:hypothetical protein
MDAMSNKEQRMQYMQWINGYQKAFHIEKPFSAASI